MYSYLKCIVYDKLLKPRQSFWITLYIMFWDASLKMRGYAASGRNVVLCLLN